MKRILFSYVFMLSTAMALVSCGGNENNTATEGTGQSADPATGLSTTPQTANAAASTGGAVFHFICPKGCAGGGGDAQGKCPVCGGDLVHNQAFHAQQPQGSDPANAITVNPTNGTPSTPPPAQNAAGVYHYTCPKGCEGGAGAQGNCAKCGTALVHNQAYHQ